MKKKIVAILALMFVLVGCGGGGISPLATDDLEGLSTEEQAEAIVENIELVENPTIVIEDNSIAVMYAPTHTFDSRLVLSDHEETFPNVAMYLVEHLSVLDFDEIVVNAYKPVDVSGVDGLSRVAAHFTRSAIEGIDFDEWEETKERFPQNFYREADSYGIQGMIWDDLDEEDQNVIRRQHKNLVDSGSAFWEHYGRIVDLNEEN